MAIFDAEERVRGVLNISGPAHRADESELHRWGAIMIAELERAGIAYRPFYLADADRNAAP